MSRPGVRAHLPRIGALLVLASIALTPAASRLGAQAPATPRTDTLTLTLADAVERSRRLGDEVRLASEQVEIANAQLGVARAGALPQLRLNASYTHTLANARAQINSAFGQNYVYGVNTNLSYNLFQGGRVWSGIQGAADLRRAARLTAEEARQLAAITVQRAYLQAIVAQRLAGLQTQNLVLSTERVTQVEQQQAAGRAARYDVLRVRVERANLEPVAIEATNQATLALLELKRLINVPVEQPVRLTTDVAPADIEVFARQASLQDSLQEADRASVRAAELTSRARRLGVRIARADLLPTLSVFAQFGYSALPTRDIFPTRAGVSSVNLCPDPATATRPCQNNGWFPDRSIGVQVSWALFDGLRTKSNIDLARAQANVAMIQLQQERERVATEVAEARAELARARASYEAQRQNAGEANEAFRLASLRQTRGLGTQLEVSDAQFALLTAQSNEARAVYDYYLAAAGLSYALGRPIPLPATGQTPARVTMQPVPPRADDPLHR